MESRLRHPHRLMSDWNLWLTPVSDIYMAWYYTNWCSYKIKIRRSRNDARTKTLLLHFKCNLSVPFLQFFSTSRRNLITDKFVQMGLTKMYFIATSLNYQLPHFEPDDSFHLQFQSRCRLPILLWATKNGDSFRQKLDGESKPWNKGTVGFIEIQ